MLKRFLILAESVDRISQAFLWLAGAFCLVLVAVTAEQVVARYLFNASSVALQELEWHLFGAIFMLAAAGTLRLGEHVRVDIVYGRLAPRTRAWIDLAGTVLFLLPTSALIVWHGWEFVAQARGYGPVTDPSSAPAGWWDQTVAFLLKGEGSPDPGGLPGRWIIKAVIPLGGAVLFLQGLAQMVRYIAVGMGGDPRLGYSGHEGDHPS